MVTKMTAKIGWKQEIGFFDRPINIEHKQIPKRVILLINQLEEIGEKQLSDFGSRGAKIAP